MDDVMRLGREVFCTANRRTFAVSGTRLAAIEALLVSVLEEGDRVVITGGKRFRDEVGDSVERLNARAEAVEPEALEATVQREPARIVMVSHVDVSTGAVHPLDDLARVTGEALLVVDASRGLGGCELRADAWALDAVVGGSEYCLDGPAGVTPLTYGERVELAMAARGAPPASNFLDLIQLQAYWSPERLNHHTAPTSLVYGLREALRLALAEGLEQRWARHRDAADTLAGGLGAAGLEVVQHGPIFVVARVPRAVDGAAVIRRLRDEYGLRVALQADSWRFALMGAQATRQHALTMLAALQAAWSA
jgi:(S)-ureidoglycine---glyoxylate transaminase